MKPILLSTGLVAIVSLLIYLITVHESLRRGGRLDETGPANVLRLTGAFLRNQQSGQTQWEIWAEKANYREDTQVTLLDTVSFKFYRSGEGALSPITGTADRARLFRDSHTVILEGHVHVLDGPDMEMRGERIFYHQRDALLTSDRPVWIRQLHTFHTGSTMEYHVDDQQLTLQTPTIYQ